MKRRWLKSAAALGTVACLAATAFAADHNDGPTALASKEADINDVYSWMSSDMSDLVLVQTVGGIPSAAAFSNSVQYVFHVGRAIDPGITAPPSDWTAIVCEFASNTDVSCTVGTPGTAATDWVNGDPSSNSGITSTSGMLQVHAGQHADPFFFYLGGFNAARGVVVAAAAAGILNATTFEPSGCVLDAVMSSEFQAVAGNANYGTMTVSEVLLGLLNGDVNPANPLGCASAAECLGNGGPGEFAVDNFATNNTLGITVQLDKSLIAGEGEYFHVYASTRTK